MKITKLYNRRNLKRCVVYTFSHETSCAHIECFRCITTAPLAPANLAVSIPGEPRNSTTLLVNWERPTCDRGILSGYQLCYVESSIGNCFSDGVNRSITDPDQLSYTISNLSINTNYIVELRGRTGAGLGEAATETGTTDEDGELW